jgi:hypothetical protein
MFTEYQPVTLSYIAPSQFVNFTGLMTNIDISDKVVLNAFNSYTVVDIWISQLSNFGCDVGAFLQVYSTSFTYLSRYNYTTVAYEDSGDDMINILADPQPNIPYVDWSKNAANSAAVADW